MTRYSTLVFFLLIGLHAFSQNPQDITIPVQVSAGLNPPAVVLSWPNPVPGGLKLSRRVKGQSGTSWTTLLNDSLTFQNGYYDTDVLAGETYEYALVKQTGNLTAYGYAHVSIFTPVVDNRGKILVFIDSTSADQLGADLIRFKTDLRGEGWQILPFHTGDFTTAQGIKNQIIASYNADPTNVKAVLLLGSIPVPYAGSTAWDGRPDHTGAWPGDAYYGDLDGVWTDSEVNLPNTARPANRNVPGDGKFDQSTLPSPIELAVGRIDFRRLSAATFGASPVELLRKYLLKNHLWRTGQYKAVPQALVGDHLGWSNGDAYAADGYRNAYPLVGEYHITNGDFLDQTNPHYLLGYGAAAGGTYTDAGNIGSSADFAIDTVNVVFAQLYGNYFGDWDYETNPLLPALLASKGGVLGCGWAGRPHWFMQGLASGETMGYCLTETQNARYNDEYGHYYGESGSHISLLGDPTLRAQIVAPATNLTAISNCDKVNLHWTASPDSGILGYLVYRAPDVNGPYTRLTPELITQSNWIDLSPVAATLFYAVRAVKLEQTPGGGVFYNSSTGVIKSTVFTPDVAPTVLGLGGVIDCNHTSLTLGANFHPVGAAIQWYKPDGSPLSGYTATEGGVYTVIATAPNGCTAIAYATVEVDTTLPVLNLPNLVTLTCTTPQFSFTIPETGPDITYIYAGQTVAPGTVISLESAVMFNSVLTVNNVNSGCSRSYTINVQQDILPPGAGADSDGTVLSCTQSSVQLFGTSSTSDVTYTWSGSDILSNLQNPVVTAAGNYCLTVTAANGCTSTDCVTVTAANGTITTQLMTNDDVCNNANGITIQSNVTGGVPPYQYTWSTGATGPEVALPAGFSGMLGLTVTDVNNCLSSASFHVPMPLQVFALTTQPTTSMDADGRIDLLISGGIAPYSFQWSTGSTTQNIDGLINGDYSVTVTDTYGCTVVRSVLLLTLGVNTFTETPVIRIAPNPASQVLGVYLVEQNHAPLQLRITDLSGRLLASQNGQSPVFFFNIQDWSSGIYILWIENDSGRKAYKVIVEK